MRDKLVWAMALVVLLSIWTVLAASLGVSPSSLEFHNVSRGESYTRVATVGTSGGESLHCTTSAEGSLSDWLVMQPSEFDLDGGSQKQFNIMLTPRHDTPNGEYNGLLYIKSRPLGSSGSGMTLTTSVAVKVKVFVVGGPLQEMDAREEDVLESTGEVIRGQNPPTTAPMKKPVAGTGKQSPPDSQPQESSVGLFITLTAILLTVYLGGAVSNRVLKKR